jgi:integrase
VISALITKLAFFGHLGHFWDSCRNGWTSASAFPQLFEVHIMATYERRKGFWRVKVRRAGFPPQTRSFNSKSLAQAWARDVEAKLDRGELVDRSEAHAHTLGDVLKRYLKDVSPHKKGYIPETYKVRAMLRFPVCQLRMSVLNSAHIAAYRDERAQSVKPATVNRDLGIISHAIETARREWGIHMPDNPVHRVRRLRAPLMRSRRLSPEEEQRLLAACKESRKPFLLPVVKLALETAMRRGEITRVERKRIDLKHNVLVLPDTKNGSARAVPLSNVAVAIIEQVLVEMPPKPDGLLFAGVTNEAIKLAFQRAVKRAKLDDFRFHDLRHEATSRLHEKGLNPIEVMSVTGHKSMSSMLRYSHVRGLAVTEKLNRPLDYQPLVHQLTESHHEGR